MSKFLHSAAALIILSVASQANAQIVINEIDYDQPGGDTAEFVELYNSGAIPVDLTGYSLQFINGSNGSTYDTINLSPVMLAAGDYYVVCANAATVPNCDLDDGPNTNFLQNGSPDAVGLFDNGAVLIDSVSYEGSVPGFVEGTGAPTDNTDGSISRAIDGVDTNDNSVDFVFLPITPGTSNSGGMMPVLVINEFDYDEPGPVDDAEFIELYNVGPGTVDLTGHTLELINGGGGGAVVYDTIVLPSVMLAAGDYFVVCGDAANVANCDLDVGPDTNLIQDGATDAIGLRDAGATLLDSVSYEGDVPGFVETMGAPGDFGANGSIARATDGVDTNNNSVDFVFSPIITPGTPNSGGPMATLVINEVDYDQPGTDNAEFIELYNAGPGSVNLNGYRVELINGTGGGAISYNFFTLPGVILAADEYYVICANAATVSNCDLDESPDTNLIQNGAPDAIGLRDPGNVLLDALSYEGDTGAPYTEGSGVGLEDLGTGGNNDVGLSRLPNGTDTDMNNIDFTFMNITPGEANMLPPSSNLVINEIDYDQPGGDAAEFVEIYNPGPGAVDLTGHTVEFINGSGGGAAVYDTIALTPMMLAADDYFVICANAATVANCDLDDGPDTNFLQNGAPDAVGLRDAATTLLDSVSYEGDVPGFVEGSGAGLADDNATANFGISRLPNGTDTNMNNVDFTFTDITPGAANGAMNTPPVAEDDNVMTDEDTLLMGDVLADNGNGADSDADMDMLMVTEVNGSMANIGMQVTLGSGALLTLNANGTFDYDPNGQFEALMAGGLAMDSFMYTLSDGTDTDTATVTVTINGVDDPPGAVADTATVLEDAAATTINVLLNDMDIDGGPLTVASTTQPAGGMVTIAGDMLSVDYTPNGDACNDGVPTDDFTYTLNGGSTATVAVTVTCVNDAPSFTAGPNQLVADNAGAQNVMGWATAVSAGPADEAGQALTFNITGNTNPAILAAGPAVDAMGNLSYTPAMGADGTTTITLELMDNGGTANSGVDTSASQMFDITVTATSADLQLDISNNALPPLMPGATFDYTLDLTNNGPGTATNSSVLINLPNQLTVTGMPACIINNGNGTLTWNAGDLAPAAMAQCVFNVQVNLPGTIRLTATATSDLADPVAGNSTDVTSTLFSQAFAVPSMNTVGLIMLALILMMAGMRQQHRMRR